MSNNKEEKKKGVVHSNSKEEYQKSGCKGGRRDHYGGDCYPGSSCANGENEFLYSASRVDFFAAFHNIPGFHNAPWRNQFGGSIWKANGSHGCVNMSYKDGA